MSSLQSPSKLSAPIDLARVRALFAKPERIAKSDFLRREISERMHDRLALVKLAPRRVVDAGCGAGADLARLYKAYPAAQVIGIDASAPMAAAAGAASVSRSLLSRLLPAKAGIDVLCGDFGSLPFAPNSVDLVWSNLALHWHPQPDRVFAEWRRVLRVDGLLMFSNFGPDTFRELRSAFATLDAPAHESTHALPFVDMHDFGDQLVEAGFSTPVMDMEVITVTYDTAQALLDDVRALGGNPLSTRRRGLLGRAAWRRVLAALEAQRRPDGKLGLTFEVIYGHAFRPAPRVTAAGEAIIRFEPRKK